MEKIKTNRHHILNTKSDWESNSDAKILRLTPILIPEIQIEQQELINQYCPAVPLLGRYALMQTVNEFEPNPNSTLKSVDRLLIAIDHASRHPRAHEIERTLCQLAIQAIEMQKEFLK